MVGEFVNAFVDSVDDFGINILDGKVWVGWDGFMTDGVLSALSRYERST